MKTCRMMFYSDYISDDQLIKAVQNSSHLDKCYVGLYSKTWNGEDHKSLNLHLLENLSDYSKNVEVVRIGEEDLPSKPSECGPMMMDALCRNHLLDHAKKRKMDIMIIQDTDEFVIEDEYRRILGEYFPSMISHGFNCCAIKWRNFWKNWHTMLVPNVVTLSDPPFEWANFAVLLNSEVKFTTSRHIEQRGNKSPIRQEWYLYHGSYVLSDQQILDKITTWSHSRDIDMMRWYREKWLNWTPETTDLHPSVNPHHWLRAIPYDGGLPEECG